MVRIADIDESLLDEAAVFLHDHLADRFDVATWRTLFTYPWFPDRPSSGVALLDDDRIVGVLGNVWSQRRIGGETVTLCNICCWSVLPEYRQHSLPMLFRATRDEKVVTTNLTPSPAVEKLFRALGYAVLDTHKIFLPPLANLSTRFRRPAPRLTTDPEEIARRVTGGSADVFRDHRETICRHLLAESEGEQCYVLFRRRVKKRVIPFTEVLHLGNPAFFARHAERFVGRILARTGAPFLALDSRFLPETGLHGIRVPRVSYTLARSVDPGQIDNAYTELSIFPV
ncbi:hypothetical protein K8I85_06930 [bacterium]|nr:hypothetical protein [bacterium]